MFCADSTGTKTGRRVELRTATSTRYVRSCITDLETVRVCSRDTQCLSTQRRKNTNGIYTPLLRSIASTEFKFEQECVRSLNQVSRDESNSVSTVLSLTSRQGSRPFFLGQGSLVVVHATACRTNAFSMCLVLRVDPFRLIMLTAEEESQHWTCCDVEHVSSVLFPGFRNQPRCCRRPMPSQAPDSAATNSASPLLSACDR